MIQIKNFLICGLLLYLTVAGTGQAASMNTDVTACPSDRVVISGRKVETPVLTVNSPMVHDPVMAWEKDVWHLYCTGNGVQHMISKDLKLWEIDTVPVLRPLPQWTRDSVPGFEHHVWAPDIVQWHGQWWLTYACSTFGKNTSAIGLMSSPSLDRAHWTDHGCVVASKKGRDNWNAIDPNIIIDDSDRPWLTFGSFWDGIQLVPLDESLHIPEGKSPVTIARRYAPGASGQSANPTSKDAGTNAIEAPFVYYRDGWYYLFVSWDYCCRGAQSNYRVAYGRSRSVEGPYLDHEGRPMTEGGGTVLLQGDGTVYEAAGHCAVYDDPNVPLQALLICHGYRAANGAPILVLRSLCFTEDGWIRVE